MKRLLNLFELYKGKGKNITKSKILRVLYGLIVVIISLNIPLGNTAIVQAASNPYPKYQDTDGDGYNEIRCTWFAWQQAYEKTGIALPRWGDAGSWYSNAANAGYSVGSTPKANSIAVWTDSGWGHVAYVTSVTNTSTFTINEGGNTDYDHTSSQGVVYNYTITNVVGQSKPYNPGQVLRGFIYLNSKPTLPRPDLSKMVPSYTVDQSTGRVTINWNHVPYSDAYRVHVYDTRKDKKVFVSDNLYKPASNKLTYTYQLPNKGLYYFRVNAANPSGGSFTDFFPIYYTGNKENIGNERYVRLKNRGAGKYVFYDDYKGMAIMKTLDNVNDTRFMYKLLRQSDGTYMIQSVYNSLRYMDINNNANSNGTKIVLNTASAAANPKFNIYSSSFGGYVIAKNDGRTVFDGASNYSNNLYTWEYVITNNQYQYFEFEDIKPSPINSISLRHIGESSLQITWNKSENAEGYFIYRKVGNGKYEYRCMTNGTSYTDTNPSFEEYNYYKVYPYFTINGERIVGDSELEVHAEAGLKSVSNLKAIAAGKNRVKITWGKSEGAEGYLIYAQKNGKYGYVGMTTKGTSFIDTKALDSSFNYYWVFPYYTNNKGKIVPGGTTCYVYAKGVIPAVNNLKASSYANGVKLTWTKQNDANGYLIYGIRPDSTYGYIGMTTTTTIFTDTKTSSKDYSYYWVYPYHKNAHGKIIPGTAPQYVYGRPR